MTRTATAASLADDRWTHRFNLFDAARALENQVLWVSANQTGTFGSLRFVGHAKVVGPGGEVLATTGVGEGLAVAEMDDERLLRRALTCGTEYLEYHLELGEYGVPSETFRALATQLSIGPETCTRTNPKVVGKARGWVLEKMRPGDGLPLEPHQELMLDRAKGMLSRSAPPMRSQARMPSALPATSMQAISIAACTCMRAL